METQLEIRGRIVNGPGKWDLMLALFEKGKQVDFTVEFKDGAGVKTIFRVKVHSIQAEDGSRESWNLAGEIVGQSNMLRDEYKLTEPEKVDWRDFTAYYHSRNRSGAFGY
ncbi:MAG: hypothetical protein A2667_03455 [Candidatus Wildermuthbacteria bacterium RIFCSPHIGHO2_01_FULL_47_27]|uniref:Uncharacterized protein n=2 Tax=Candidatus Wildermuthiibacteriota TaxID=1817923 RepID=A0A1G2RMK9_9BACT|nr:MAG: hypothetical protein UY15_C0008G0010 [Parcubacteria group bacterium GW2011_GWA2_47_9]OHA63523.1 MAG: hypothetical protein A2667_03455 [Candidatus Wildermuthbacteria bacterium RIFCSPHIGHO2_01_FULL_47_27]OHA67515.1 MAG: hypothetical protein A3D59_03810 [Candidatus Wildermuthbacteria bacterium RIFCSPHIGHO2_02_FULL_47_17]OHA74080.1 MAG: hypothetical protein A3A32_02190 [Candidatus Wildermuthbacteria bacterium RIFCSPLOWO2_01_FULL_48_35]